MEAAVAIGVVAVLSGILVPLVLKTIRDAHLARARNDLHVIAAAIAAQVKDTGCRPSAAGGPGGSTGAGIATWYGAGRIPLMGGQRAFAETGNTFTKLFTAPNNTTGTTRAQGNLLFGFAPATPGHAEFGYKGPYLSGEVALKTDPWGSAYFILGYNELGQAENGPIWVVCAGPSRAILPANFHLHGHSFVHDWDYSLESAGNLAVRVH